MRPLIVRTAIAALLLLPVLATAETLKISTLAPEGSEWMAAFRAGAEEVAERTDGRVELRFYGSGVQGINQQLLRKIRIGQMQGGTFTAGGLGLMYPDAMVLSMPLVFRDLDEVEYVREQMEPQLRQGLEEAGWVNFGFAGSAFAYLMSKEAVRTPDDLDGLKIWIPEGDEVAYAGVRALGGAPVGLPLTDVLTGLETDLIDSASTSPAAAVVLQWHTRVRYLTDLPLQYLYATLVIQERAFSRLDEADQAIVREVFEGVMADLDAREEPDNAEALAALRDVGIETVVPPADQVPEWRQRVQSSNEQLVADGLLGADTWQAFKDHLATYRAGSTASTSP